MLAAAAVSIAEEPIQHAIGAVVKLRAPDGFRMNYIKRNRIGFDRTMSQCFGVGCEVDKNVRLKLDIRPAADAAIVADKGRQESVPIGRPFAIVVAHEVDNHIRGTPLSASVVDVVVDVDASENDCNGEQQCGNNHRSNDKTLH
jgi:hypothetical protein